MTFWVIICASNSNRLPFRCVLRKSYGNKVFFQCSHASNCANLANFLREIRENSMRKRDDPYYGRLFPYIFFVSGMSMSPAKAMVRRVSPQPISSPETTTVGMDRRSWFRNVPLVESRSSSHHCP